MQESLQSTIIKNPTIIPHKLLTTWLSYCVMSNNDTFKLTAPAEKNSGGSHHSLNSATPLGKKSYQQGSERLSFFPSYNFRYAGLARVGLVRFLEKHGIICHVFMGISTRCPLPQHSFSLELSSLSKLNSVDSTDVPRDVFAQVTVQWYWVVYSLLSAMPPPSSLLLAFISLHGFGSDVLFPAFSQERERGGERERKGGPFKRGMTDALLKEAGPFESLAPPCSPPPLHPMCLAPLSLGGGSNPPTGRFVTVSHLADWNGPTRKKHTHSPQ